MKTSLALLAAALAAAQVAAQPNPKPTPRPTPVPYRVVLVQADGPAPDVETFMSRFQSEVSDRAIALVDARHVGARISVVNENPPGSESRAFREEFPGDAYLQITISPCETRVSSHTFSDTTPEGYRYTKVVSWASSTCTAHLEAFRAEGGKLLAKLDVKGAASWREDQGEGAEVDSSEQDAIREAAEKAAKKLAPSLKR